MLKKKSLEGARVVDTYVDGAGQVQQLMVPVYKEEDISSRFFFTYLDAFKLIDKVGGQAFKLFMFISFYMEEGNMIRTDKRFKERYAAFYQQQIGKTITDHMIRKLLSKLKKEDVVRDAGRNNYFVNPRYSWRGKSKKREAVIKEIKV